MDVGKEIKRLILEDPNYLNYKFILLNIDF